MSKSREITNNELIINYLIHNQQMMQEVCQEAVNKLPELYKTEDVLLHDEITSNFISFCKSLIIMELVKRLSVTTEEVMNIVQNLNIKEYFKI